MAEWFNFDTNFDFRWPSRAVTAFKAGTIAYVKDEVVEQALKKGAGTVTTRPGDDDPRKVTTPTVEESKTGNPASKNSPENVAEQAAGVTTPETLTDSDNDDEAAELAKVDAMTSDAQGEEEE